jgi:integrase
MNSWVGTAPSQGSLSAGLLSSAIEFISNPAISLQGQSIFAWEPVRRLAHEAADCGLLSPDLAEGIRRVKGVKKIGMWLGNWLAAEQSQKLCGRLPTRDRLKEKRDRALLAVLLACGVRRHEVVELNFGHIQQREEHWAIVDLRGRRVTLAPFQCQHGLNMSSISGSRRRTLLRENRFLVYTRLGSLGREPDRENYLARCQEYAAKAGIDKLAPHDLRRTCAPLSRGWRRTWSRFSFCLATSQFRQLNDISAANSGFAEP